MKYIFFGNAFLTGLFLLVGCNQDKGPFIKVEKLEVCRVASGAQLVEVNIPYRIDRSAVNIIAVQGDCSCSSAEWAAPHPTRGPQAA